MNNICNRKISNFLIIILLIIKNILCLKNNNFIKYFIVLIETRIKIYQIILTHNSINNLPIYLNKIFNNNNSSLIIKIIV